MNKTVKTILIFAVAGAILFGMYAFFLAPAPSAGVAVTGGLITTPTDAGASPDSTDIVSLLATMQKIQLDRTIFASQLYQSLHDFGVTIASEPYGKDDPFADLDAGASASVAPAFQATTAPRAARRASVPATP